MRCPYQEGAFPFPVKYGYALAGEIVDGPSEILGQRVFALHPHQELACIASSHLHELPEDVPLRRAVLAANTETAVNVLWDTSALPGERVLVVGGGVLGLLVASLVAQTDKNEITVVDINPARGDVARALGVAFASPEGAPRDQDIVIHTSATESGLKMALQCAAPEGRIIEASWYGDRQVSLPLGEAFHSRRLRLISSQVGAIPLSHRGKWTPKQRMQKALNHLRDDKFDVLITDEIKFSDAPAALPRILARDSPGLMTTIRYF
jgi:threonine dehydrogenase-like Zn-dependent dehydrogenase